MVIVLLLGIGENLLNDTIRAEIHNRKPFVGEWQLVLRCDTIQTANLRLRELLEVDKRHNLEWRTKILSEEIVYDQK